MKFLNLKKLTASTLIFSSMFTFNALGVSAAWRQDSRGWWNTEGSSWSIGWRLIDNNWYYFGNDGYMKTGWLQNNSNWYYLSDSGAMKTGWLLSNGSWYYLSAGGSMMTGWLKYNNNWYYLSNSGAMVTDTTIDGCYLNKDGIWIEKKNVLESVSIKTEKDTYPLGTKSITFNIINNYNDFVEFSESFPGPDYSVEKYIDDKWVLLKFKQRDDESNVGYSDYAAYGPGSTHEITRSLSSLEDFDNLTAGKYRIVETCYYDNDYKHFDLYAEFNLK